MVLRAPNTCWKCGLEEGAFLCGASYCIILTNCIMINYITGTMFSFTTEITFCLCRRRMISKGIFLFFNTVSPGDVREVYS